MSGPFNPATVGSSRRKLFGGNIVQVPVADGGPQTLFQWSYIFTNFATLLPNWIVPQLKRWKSLGANTVRMPGGVDGVISGAYTQAYYNTCLNQLLATYRQLGLLHGGNNVSLGSYGEVGTFAWPVWGAAVTSVYQNCLNPNADIMAYYEAGLQETHLDGDYGLTVYLAQLAKGLGTIPVLISSPSADLSRYAALTSADVDVLAPHDYPNSTTVDPQSVHDRIASALRSRGTCTAPIHIEECGRTDYAGVYQNKADYLDQMGQHAYAHPECAGLTPWGGFGPTPDGDWTLYAPPAAGQELNPAATWADTVASLKLASIGPGNRRLTYAITHPSQSVAAGGIVSNTLNTTTSAFPTVPGFIVRPLFLAAQRLNWTGTVTASASTTLSVTRTDRASSAVTVVAGPVSVASGSAQAFALAGQATGDATYNLVSAGAATIAGSSTLLIGNYVFAPQIIGVGGKPLRFTSGLVGV